jgi:hypothetical protein
MPSGRLSPRSCLLRPGQAAPDAGLCGPSLMRSSTVCATGSAWRHLPRQFPPWGSVHRWFLALSRCGVFECLAHALAMADRQQGRIASRPDVRPARLRPSSTHKRRAVGVGVAGQRGFDPARRVVARKRHLMTNTGRAHVVGGSLTGQPARQPWRRGSPAGIPPPLALPCSRLCRPGLCGRAGWQSHLRRGDDRRGAARAEGMPSIHVGG